MADHLSPCHCVRLSSTSGKEANANEGHSDDVPGIHGLRKNHPDVSNPKFS
jgi:hypothetical protein